jgi:membrane protein implicated in regulation of membrane protease activity
MMGAGAAAMLAQAAGAASGGTPAPAPGGYGWASIVGTVIGMLVVAVIAWRAVQRQERGDDALEAKLRADDERAARGRAAEAGASTPDDPRNT